MRRAVVDPLLGPAGSGSAAVRGSGRVADAALLGSAGDPATALAFEDPEGAMAGIAADGECLLTARVVLIVASVGGCESGQTDHRCTKDHDCRKSPTHVQLPFLVPHRDLHQVSAGVLSNQALLRGGLLRAAKLQRIEPGDVFVRPARRFEGEHVPDPARHVHLGCRVRAAEDRGVAR